MASASATVSVDALPEPARTPLVVVAPGSTMSRFVPRLSICALTAAFAPWPTATIVISAATPMKIPSIVRAERILLRDSARPAASSAMRVKDHVSSKPRGWLIVGAGAAGAETGAQETAASRAGRRSSDTMTPSRIVMTRSANAAMSGSCVTRTTVRPRWRLNF